MQLLKNFYKNYTYECWVLCFSGALICSVLYFGYRFFQQSQELDAHDLKKETEGRVEPSKISLEQKKVQPNTSTIIVDISGAVEESGAYSLSEGDRLDELLNKAGGLSTQADKDFFNRNFNKASLLYDQQKIYIPRTDEIQQGIFVEGRYVIDIEADNSRSESNEDQYNGKEKSDGISINMASQKELDTLTGIGEVTAEKIIDNRPYKTIEELLDKKVVSEKIFNDIKEQINL